MKHLLLALVLFATSLTAADLTITGASLVPGPNATITKLTAGAALAIGDIVYRDATDSFHAKLADANSATAAVRVVYGISLSAVASGQLALILTDDDSLTLGATLTACDTLVLSGTPGKIAPDADAVTGWYKTILGVATSTRS